jgi:hypothetical protein
MNIHFIFQLIGFAYLVKITQKGGVIATSYICLRICTYLRRNSPLRRSGELFVITTRFLDAVHLTSSSLCKQTSVSVVASRRAVNFRESWRAIAKL